MGFSGGSEGKECACKAGDTDSIPASGRSPVGGNVNPLQYSCLEKLIDRGAWEATVHGVAELDTTEVTKRRVYITVSFAIHLSPEKSDPPADKEAKTHSKCLTYTTLTKYKICSVHRSVSEIIFYAVGSLFFLRVFLSNSRLLLPPSCFSRVRLCATP